MTSTKEPWRVRLLAAPVAAVCLLTTVLGCSINPATGERQLVLMSESQEIALGRENHEQILQQMGVYDDPEVQAYVDRLGQELAALSERPDLPWTFTVLDDPVVNAFALPGGFIYVTRGILTHLDNEAELVSVLGHEIGHVTGRHGVERLSKAQLAGIGLVVGMIASPELQRFGDLAQQGLGLLFLKYSRDDEREADELGLRYTLRGGWDAREMPGVFSVLKAVGEAGGSDRLPSWLSTHPDPDLRTERIGARLAEMDRDFSGSKVNRPAYLGQLDGMMFGANPREGFFRDGLFLHPDLEFTIMFPAEWKTSNQRQQVVGVSQQQDAIVTLMLAAGSDPAAAAREFLSQDGVRGGRISTQRINGHPAAEADFEVPRENADDVRGRVAFVRYGDNTYRLLGYTLESKWSDHSREIGRFIDSFDRLREQEALKVQPARVDLVTPSRDLSIEGFNQKFPSTVSLQTLALINHLPAGGTLAGGMDAKRIVGGLGPQ